MSKPACDNSNVKRYNVPSYYFGTSSIPQSTIYMDNEKYSQALKTALTAPNTVVTGSTNLQVLVNYSSGLTAATSALGAIATAVQSSFTNIYNGVGENLLAGVYSQSFSGMYNTADDVFAPPNGVYTLTRPLEYPLIVPPGKNTDVDFLNNQFSNLAIQNVDVGATFTGFFRVYHVLGDTVLGVLVPVVNGFNSLPLCDTSDIFPPETDCSNPESDEQYFGEDCYQFDNCPYA